MSEAKITKAWADGCTRNILIAIVALVVILGVFVCLVVLSVLLPLQPDQQVLFWSSGTFLFLLLVPVVIFILGFWLVRRRTRFVDSIFAPLGFTGKTYLWNGRQYHGKLDGRQVDAYYYRGPTLDIYIASPLNTRMGIGLKGSLSRAASNDPKYSVLVTDDPAMAHLSIFSLDEGWGREILDNLPAREVILRLTAAQPGFEFRNLLFQPEAVHFQINRINRNNLTSESLHAWVNDLLELVQIIETLPAPLVTVASSSLEQKARTSRGDFILPVAGVTCAVIGLFTTLLVVVLFLIILLERGGL